MSNLGGNSPSEDVDKSNNLQGDDGADGTNGTNGTNGIDGNDGVVQTVVGGTNVTVDATDPANPIVNASASGATPTTTKGDMIARSATADDRLPVGVNGQALLADSTELLGVKWGAAGSSTIVATNERFSPPLIADFPTWHNQQGATVVDDVYRGLLLTDMVTDLNIDTIISRVKPMPSGSWTATARITGAFRQQSFSAFGIIMRDSATDRSIVHRVVVSGVSKRISVTQYALDTSSGDVNAGSQAYNTDAMTWFRIEDDTVNFTWYVSHDGVNFFQIAQAARTAWMANPDQIGFFISPESEEPLYLACDYWDDKDNPASPAVVFNGFVESTPASATAPGTRGQMTWDNTHIYMCVATNTWKRVAIATF